MTAIATLVPRRTARDLAPAPEPAAAPESAARATETEIVAVPPAQSDAERLERFRALFRSHPTGAAVIAAHGERGRAALTVSSLVSVGADPALVAFSLSKASSAGDAIAAASSVTVHFVDEDIRDLAVLGATSGADRFPEGVWRTLPTGEPRIEAARHWLRGDVVRTVDVGPAVLVVVEVREAHTDAGAEGPARVPLVYHERAWHRFLAPGE